MRKTSSNIWAKDILAAGVNNKKGQIIDAVVETVIVIRTTFFLQLNRLIQ